METSKKNSLLIKIPSKKFHETEYYNIVHSVNLVDIYKLHYFFIQQPFSNSSVYNFSTCSIFLENFNIFFSSYFSIHIFLFYMGSIFLKVVSIWHCHVHLLSLIGFPPCHPLHNRFTSV